MALLVSALGARLTSSLHPQKLDGYMLPLKRPSRQDDCVKGYNECSEGEWEAEKKLDYVKVEG